QFFYGLLYGLVDFFIPESWKHRDISGQVVLITGGGSGIGQLMALKFAKLNAKVVIWDVNQAGMQTTVEMIHEAKLNPEKSCFCYRVNICNRKSVYDTAKRVQAEVGPVDILINNAGVVSGKYLLDLP